MWFTHDVTTTTKMTGFRYGIAGILPFAVTWMWVENARESAMRTVHDPSVIRDANDGFPWVTRT